MQTIDTYNFQGKKALIRVDFNVPLNDKFEITDDTRMRAAIPTIRKVLAGGGAVILMSHLGRPKGVDSKYSLKHIQKHLEELLGQPVRFADDCIGESAKYYCSKICVIMQKKKVNPVVWLTMPPMKKKKLQRQRSKNLRRNLSPTWLL